MAAAIPDTLVNDLVAYWSATATRPAGMPAGWNFLDYRSTEKRELPCVVIGHEGFARENVKGMTGTGRTKLRMVVMSDMDDAKQQAAHETVTGTLQAALRSMATVPGPLASNYLHAFLPESDIDTTEDRRRISVLPYTVIHTAME